MFGLTTARLLSFAIAAVAILLVVGTLFNLGRSAGIAHDAKRSAPIIAGLRSKLDTCNTTLDATTATLERQNAAVTALRVESDERTARAERAIQAAQKQVKSFKAKIVKLEKAKPTGDQCAASRDLIITSLAEDRP